LNNYSIICTFASQIAAGGEGRRRIVT